MKKTIKQLYTIVGSPFVMDPTVTYPTIEGNTSNFLTDYATYKEEFDRYFLHEYGSRFVDLEAETDADAGEEWEDECKSILLIYLQSWARLYYALNIDFNPIFNVEEHTTNTYGQHVTDVDYAQRRITDAYGQHQRTDQYGATSESETIGAKETTNGAHTDGVTNYTVAFDSGTEKETGRSSDSVGAQTINEGSQSNSRTTTVHSDTHTDAAANDTHTEDAKKDTTTSKQHVDTIDRSGNIGTVSATDLLIREERFRRNYSFFKNCFLTIIEEVGAYYECDFI